MGRGRSRGPVAAAAAATTNAGDFARLLVLQQLVGSAGLGGARLGGAGLGGAGLGGAAARREGQGGGGRGEQRYGLDLRDDVAHRHPVVVVRGRVGAGRVVGLVGARTDLWRDTASL